MLTLFILKSGNPNADPKKSLASFQGLVDQFYYINSLSEVNSTKKNNDWFGVIYDDEVIGDGLTQVAMDDRKSYCPLKIHLSQTKADVLVLYKRKGGQITRSPRFFRKFVKLSENTLLPAGDHHLQFDTVLDGWIQ